MKKICFCTTVSITLKTFVVETAKYLHERCGYDITLICNEDKVFEASLPEYIHYVPVHMARGIDFSALSTIRRFTRIFKEQNFDMVQYSTPNAACYASIAAKCAKVPIRLYCQWGIRYVGMSGASRKVFKVIEKMVCNNSTDIRAVSPMNKAFAVAEGLYPEEKAVVVGNGGTIGVDMRRYDISKKVEYRSAIRKQYGISDGAFVYGFAGRVSADKGCTELLTAFWKIAESEPNARLLIVGPVEDHCGISTEILDWARKSDQIVLTGMVDGSKMNEYYSAMDVLVHPTYREGFGMVLQEAGALGITMITTKIPGASEVMEDGVSCLLVEPQNVLELESAMRMLITDRERSQEIGQAAYLRTKQYYNRPVMLENQRIDYEKLLNRCKNADTMRIVLTEKELDRSQFPADVQVVKVTYKTIDAYNHNSDVVAIAGSRAMAVKANQMDFPGVRFFQLTSAGFDGVPLKELGQKGVRVANAGSTYSVPIAETVVMGMLLMAKRLHSNPNNRHAKIQRHYIEIRELYDKKVMILGAGSIGTEIAKRLSGFNMIVDGYAQRTGERPYFGRVICERKELINCISDYDYVISTLPDSESTRGFFDRELLSWMKDTSVIVNVGRKAVFNEDDLYNALKHKAISGAVLDMFEKIPNPLTNKFRRLSNVIVLPGVSAISQEVDKRLCDYMTDNIKSELNDTPVPGRII